MGRPETPIPEKRPMAAMANHLRHLRRNAGSPSYRTLGALVHVEQQSLSQTANGNRVGWGRVLLYVQALRLHNPQSITTTDLATLKSLHQLGEQRFHSMATRALRSQQSKALWAEIDNTTAGTVGTQGRRATGRWTLTPGITDAGRLNTVQTMTELFTLLTGTAAGRGIDLLNPRRSRAHPAQPFSWFGDKAEPPTPAVPHIREPHELTLDTMTEIIRICGGNDGDCTAWLAAWERVHRNTRDNGPPPTPPLPALPAPVRTAPPVMPRNPLLPGWPGKVMRRPAATGVLAVS